MALLKGSGGFLDPAWVCCDRAVWAWEDPWSRPSPDPSRPAFTSNIFPADWLNNQIPSEWAGVGGWKGEWKVGPLPLDNTIISAPLARNAKFHSPLLFSVRQSKLREGTEAPAESASIPAWSEPTMNPHKLRQVLLLPPEAPFFQLHFYHICALRVGWGHRTEVPNVSPRVRISTKNLSRKNRSNVIDRARARRDPAPSRGGHFGANSKPGSKVYLPPKCKSNN